MYNYYSPQVTIDKINNQISELEKMRNQLSMQPTQPTNLTQNFQIAPSNNTGIKYANNIEEVNKEQVFVDTPFFSKDMSVLWLKNAQNETKTYSLEEMVIKDEKDLKIEFLEAKLNELERELRNNESSDTNDDGTTKKNKPKCV